MSKMPELNDHDLLVTLHEQVKQLRLDIKEIKEGSAHRIEKLEIHKMDSKDFVEWAKMISDHEARIRSNERYVSLAIGALVIIQALIYYFVSK